MGTDKTYDQLADDASIKKTFEALEKKGVHPYLVNSKEEAEKKVIDLIPHHDEVMNMTSMTVVEIGLDDVINETNEFISVRNILNKGDLSEIEKKRLGTAHEWVVGSVHAVTEDGQFIIASATGSQLSSYAYGANNVIWIVGTQKIMKTLDEGMDRLYKYVFPLEDERAMNAYGVHSGVNKILIINKEAIPGRMHVIFVKEKLGF